MENLLNNQREIFAKEFEKILLTQDICDKSLEISSENCGLDKNHYKLLFPGGLVELLPFVSKLHDEKLLMELSELETPVSITKRVSLATQLRIKLVDQIILQKILSFYSNPLYMVSGLKPIFKTCDIIWRYAGDKSTDYNYYTKRSLLLSVYLPSLFHYIGDSSINCEKTDEFIDSSLEKIVKLGSLKTRIKLPKIEDIPILRMFV